MRKVYKSLFLILLMFISIFTLVACTEEKGELSRVTLDINPSLEILVDENKKVVSVTALNDDAGIIISGEEIVGEDIEKATEKLINISIETGYIVNDESSTNKIEISVSGDSDYAKKLANKIIAKGNEVLKDNKIDKTLNQVNSVAVDELKSIVLKNSTFTEEEVNAMNEVELLQALKVSRMETALLISEDLRELYYEAKKYEIDFAEKEATKNIISNIDGVSKVLLATYSTFLENYRKVITSTEELKYNTLISPDSLYQKTLVELRKAKAEYLEKRAYVATIEVTNKENEEIKIQAEIELNNLKEAYDKIEQKYIECGNKAIESFDFIIKQMKEAENALSEIEEKLLSVDVEQVLTEKASEIESSINERKDKFFEEFETAHKEDIEKALAGFKEQKEQLKNQLQKNE